MIVILFELFIENRARHLKNLSVFVKFNSVLLLRMLKIKIILKYYQKYFVQLGYTCNKHTRQKYEKVNKNKNSINLNFSLFL